MRISVVILVIAGIVAALAASVAVNAMNSQSWNVSGKGISANSPDVGVLVAKEHLAAMTVMDEKFIETKSMPRDKAPANAMTDPLQAVGKVLVAPLEPGQVLTTAADAHFNLGVIADSRNDHDRAIMEYALAKVLAPADSSRNSQ